MALRTHMTKIVATIGPACDSPETLRAMIESGMDIARLNFSHGTPQEHASRIQRLRAAAFNAGRDVSIMVDLPGPKIRIGNFAGEKPIELRRGHTFSLTTDDIPGDKHGVSVNLPNLHQVVHRDDVLYLNDGLIRLKATEVVGNEVRCVVVAGGPLHSRKGLNLPGIDLGMSAFTDRDREWLRFALDHGVDAISQSFVNSAADVEAVRAAAAEFGHAPMIIAKIERTQAVERIEPILQAADGIMVARGDLGVETPIERIAIVQKDLIRRAMQAGKPVITATQMLESMTRSRQPTRAEATDVANAILDGTDCVMLSAESAAGDYPVEAVAMLAAIAAATEPHRQPTSRGQRDSDAGPTNTKKGCDPAAVIPIDIFVPELMARSIKEVLTAAKTAAVVVLPGAERFVPAIARWRFAVWVAAFSHSVSHRRQMMFGYGVAPMAPSVVDRDALVRQWVSSERLEGDLAVLIHGPAAGDDGHNVRLELIELNLDGFRRESSPSSARLVE